MRKRCRDNTIGILGHDVASYVDTSITVRFSCSIYRDTAVPRALMMPLAVMRVSFAKTFLAARRDDGKASKAPWSQP